jgi:hypothetical protein
VWGDEAEGLGYFERSFFVVVWKWILIVVGYTKGFLSEMRCYFEEMCSKISFCTCAKDIYRTLPFLDVRVS